MEEVKTNAGQGLGIAGLIMGIMAVPLAILGCTSVLGLILGLAGIVLSGVGLSQATKSNGVRGLPTAGLVVSILGTCIALLWIFFFARLVTEGGRWWSKEGVRIMEEIHEDFGEELEKAFEDVGTELEKLGGELEQKLEDLEYDLEWEERWSEEISDDEFEEVLDAYQSLIGDYFELSIQAGKGDLNALAEYVIVSARAVALATRISVISGRLTQEQRDKFEELQENFDKAMEKDQNE